MTTQVLFGFFFFACSEKESSDPVSTSDTPTIEPSNEPEELEVCQGDIDIETNNQLYAARNCMEITGELSISLSGLEDIDELSNLRKVGGAVYIKKNAFLKDIDLMVSIKYVRNHIFYFHSYLN